MSHAMLFELDAVAETAQIALAWGITIRQNRGDTTAREPRTYHGRGFSLSAIPERRAPIRPSFDRSSRHRCPRRASAAAGGIRGLDGRRANIARGQRCRHCGAEFYADRAGRMSRMGTLLPAWIYAGLRPVPLLVSPLLVSSPRTGPPHHAALSRVDDAGRDALRGGAFEQRCRAGLQTDRRHRAHRALASTATGQP